MNCTNARTSYFFAVVLSVAFSFLSGAPAVAEILNCKDRHELIQPWSEETKSEFLRLIDGNSPHGWAAREEAVSDCVSARILSDLKKFYAADLENRVEANLAAFTGDARGRDGGRGLHIVKKYDEGENTIWVNEEWPVRFGRLELPDEIRVRSRVFRSSSFTRGAVGSDQDYISLRVRVAWDEESHPKFFIENIFKSGTPRDRLVRRDPISNVMCQSCHASPNFFAKSFAVQGIPLHHESIVQPAWLKKSIGESEGFGDLLETWPMYSINRDREAVVAQLKSTFSDLKNIKIPFQNMLSYLDSELRTPHLSLTRLDPDQKLDSHFRLRANTLSDGRYEHAGHAYEDGVAAYERTHFHRGETWRHTSSSVRLP